jgi:hypothetical protein
VLLPSEQTHGEHKAASILALEAIELLPAGERPIVLGAQAGEGDPAPYKSLSGCLQDRFENFWLFSVNRTSATGRAESLFAAIAPRPERAAKIGIAEGAKPQ